jgi:hypothetical protein
LRASAPASISAWLISLLLPAWVHGAGAEVRVDDLLAEGRLQVRSKIEPAGGIVARQKVALVLELATDRWFAGGTRIRIPEVPGLVILQTESFAANASEVREGHSWVLQRWTLDVYPQRAGEFRIPPVTLAISVSHETAGEVAGEVPAPLVAFTAGLPTGLGQGDEWVAAPVFSVNQSFDRELENLAVGDAFEREIRFRAEGVMAMMLPAFEPRAHDGLAVYADPPALENRSNRGVSSASRRQRISYVVEAPGNYTLPSADYYWWDTREKTLNLLSLPAVSFAVAGVAPGPASAQGALPPRLIPMAGAALALAAAVFFALRRLPRQRLARAMTGLRQAWRRLRSPALPRRLNPGSSAGE